MKTQDLTPPVLTVVALPPPTESSLSAVVQLDEPGTIHVGLWLASSDAQVTKNASCPPTFTVSGSSTGGMLSAAWLVDSACRTFSNTLSHAMAIVSFASSCTVHHVSLVVH